MSDAIIKRFDAPDEARQFDKGAFQLVRIGSMSIGRASYEPGWRWSEHVGPAEGKKLCDTDHIGLVLSGRVMVAMEDGTEFELAAGDLFDIKGAHDSWVIGDEPYVSLHFLGAEQYASGGSR